MEIGLSRRLKRIERKLPPIEVPKKIEFSLELGYVIFAGIKIPFQDFWVLFPKSSLLNVDFDVDVKILIAHLVREKSIRTLQGKK